MKISIGLPPDMTASEAVTVVVAALRELERIRTVRHSMKVEERAARRRARIDRLSTRSTVLADIIANAEENR